MPDSGFFLDDSDARLIQSMIQRIEQLEAQTAERMAPGMIVPHAAVVRSPFWSASHLAAVNTSWTHHYLLNEVSTDAIARDRTEEGAFNGLLAAETQAGMPLQGQPGGLASDGSYSYYFPGKEKSRIDLPLLTTKEKLFHCEIIFKPQVVPQKSLIFYNGTYGTNGWGLAIDNGAGAEGKLLCIRYGAGLIVSTGIELTAEQWHAVNFWVTEGGVANIHIARVDPASKVVSALTYSGSPVINTPTTRACIAGPDPTTASAAFKGWIDEVSVYNGNIPLTEVVKSYFDRYRTALEPSAPPGFILPDGSAVGRAEYDRLYKTIGTIYGVGDGSTTFNLPDLRARFPLMRSTAALATKGGEETHILSTAEMPFHQHAEGQLTNREVEPANAYGATLGSVSFDGGLLINSGYGGHVTSGVGGGGAHNNMPPYLVLNALLKT